MFTADLIRAVDALSHDILRSRGTSDAGHRRPVRTLEILFSHESIFAGRTFSFSRDSCIPV
jgi:hypothetical protein